MVHFKWAKFKATANKEIMQILINKTIKQKTN